MTFPSWSRIHLRRLQLKVFAKIMGGRICFHNSNFIRESVCAPSPLVYKIKNLIFFCSFHWSHIFTFLFLFSCIWNHKLVLKKRYFFFSFRFHFSNCDSVWADLRQREELKSDNSPCGSSNDSIRYKNNINKKIFLQKKKLNKIKPENPMWK